MTNSHFFSVSRTSEQVARQIADYISFEKLKPGTRLPTERKLSELLEVSRSSVREGLCVLEILGYVYSKQGQGTFVSESSPFLIPKQVIQHVPEMTQMDHYFGISAMVVEKIIELSVNHKKNGPPHELDRERIIYSLDTYDWDTFSNHIITLGNQLKNPYYKYLWKETYEFLRAHNYFERKEISVKIFLQQILDSE